MSTDLAIPTIHINGTSRQSLIEGFEKAADALADAIVAVGETCPNARDYYPQGNDAHHRAAAQHQARLAKLREVEREIMELLAAVAG